MAGLALLKGISATAGTLSKAATIGSTALSVVGTLRGAAEVSSQQKQQAAQAQQAAELAKAQGQRRAAAEYRRGRLLAGRQRVAAAGQGGLQDQSVINLMADAESATDYNAQVVMADAETQARGYQGQASVARANAGNARTAGILGAAGAGLSGYSKMYEKFGRPNKKASRVGSRYG